MNTNTNGFPSAVADDRWEHFRQLPAAQQPEWPDIRELRAVLRALPQHDLVDNQESQQLKDELLALDATGGLILQLGDCVEDIDIDVYADARRKLAFIDAATDHLQTSTGRPTLTVGRIAGQHAKPRSNEHEVVDGVALPVYRGPIINAPPPTWDARLPSPERIALAHAAARTAHAAIAHRVNENPGRRTVWTSHELLLLDYELQFLRPGVDGNHLATTHWPWIGARTRQPDGAHIAVAASLSNPVSVKIGPDTSPGDAVDLSVALNPHDRPGKLTFIARMGRHQIDRLTDIARAVRRHGRRVHWISDPMHGNTVTTSLGVKTRHVEDLIREIRRFQQILLNERIRPAGLHLEATPDDVHECTDGGAEPSNPQRYRTLLDPRLNPDQTRRVLDEWFA